MFKAMAINTNLQAALRLIITIPVLLAGLKINGALAAIVMSYLITLLISFIQLKNKLRGNISDKIGINKIKFSKESIQIMIGQLGLTSLVSIDLIFVQHFLPNQAGFYAGLALFGKALLFASSPLNTVLFPMIISSEKKQQAKLILFSILILTIICVLAFITFSLFSNILIQTLLSKSYLVVADLLPLYTIFIAFYCIANLVINVSIALNRYLTSYAAIIATLFQVIGIMYYHENLNQIIYVSLITTVILTVFCFGTLIDMFYRKERHAS